MKQTIRLTLALALFAAAPAFAAVGSDEDVAKGDCCRRAVRPSVREYCLPLSCRLANRPLQASHVRLLKLRQHGQGTNSKTLARSSGVP